MGEAVLKSTKPLQINPIRLSQPMGAALAFLGVDRCMPLMHGAIGCTSFTKVFFTRHFAEPIAIQTTAVSDVTAVLDGGDHNITEAVKNITHKVSPALIGLHTTGLTETKGDDIRRVSSQVAQVVSAPLVYVNTPDYEGSYESGWTLATKAMIEQLVEPTEVARPDKLVLLPHVSLTPIEVEKVKEFIEGFGFEVLALPDLSTSLDGHLGEKQAALSSGGITIDAIRGLGDAATVMTLGASMKSCASSLQDKNPAMVHQHFDHVQGLEATDALVAFLLQQSGRKEPPISVIRWRQRLQDCLLDTHFALGQTRFLLTGEPDQLTGQTASLREAGGRVDRVIAAAPSPVLEPLTGPNVQSGDLEDAELLAAEYDMILGNTHCESLARRLRKKLLLRGAPNWEQVGNQLKSDVLYEGSCHFLCEVANRATEEH